MPARSPKSRYMQIANDLRRDIEAGIYSGPLPSEPELCERYSVSRAAVRQAIALLRDEGRIYTVKGRGSYARPPAPVRRVGPDRYRVDLQAARTGQRRTSVTHDHDTTWEKFQPQVHITEEPATAEVAALFDLPTGTPLSRRDLVFHIDGWPVSMATSYYPLNLVAGTWIVTPESEPTPGGMFGHLLAVGVTPTRIVEQAVSRMATPREAQTLRIGPGPVLAITRQTYAGERVVEVAREITMPGESVILIGEVDLT